ncbi:glycosyl hydrolase-related protein [Streptomyces roseolus]|uniref:glycosyl hydrolase-related protein n=1 Tax=Streptomyces roseolus TaxID=67358 RepID=UPI00378F54B8
MLKPAEDGGGIVLRLTNPTSAACEARVHAPEGASLTPVRMDEQPTGAPVVRQGAAESVWPLAPFATLTLRVEPSA